MPRTASRTPGASSPNRNRPGKLFYRIQEVAEITGLKPYILRYWESEFRELSPEKDQSDQRRYRQSDIEMIQQIKDLLYNQKYTIAGARQRIRMDRSLRSSRRDEPSNRSALHGIRAELAELMKQLTA